METTGQPGGVISSPGLPRRGMMLREVTELLEAEPCTALGLPDCLIDNAGASDLMSDVLAFTKPGSVLLTGLTSPQVIRTAEMLDLKAIIFVRNKPPSADAVALAEEMGLPLFVSPYPLYEAAGILYCAGMRGSMDDATPDEHWASRQTEKERRVGALAQSKTSGR